MIPQSNHPLLQFRGLQFVAAIVAISNVTACSSDDDACTTDPNAPGCATSGGASTGGRSTVATGTNRGGSSAGGSKATGGSVSTGGAATSPGAAGVAGATAPVPGGATGIGGAVAGAPGTGGANAGAPGTGGASVPGGAPGTAGTPSTGGSTGVGGSGGTAGIAGATGTTKVCSNPATDCPTPPNECVRAVCNGQVCGVSNVAAATAVTSQTAGDCKVKQCDGAGNIATAIDNTDLPNDGNACTTDTCTSGTPAYPYTAAGTTCDSTKKCDGSGSCVACTAPSDCPGTDTECHTRTCTAGVCGVANTAAGTATTSQTPGDCHKNQCDGSGNIASSVDDTDLPDDSNACTVDTCTAGVLGHANEPSLTDCGTGLKCDGSGACVGCTVATDCAGTDTECQARTCTVGVCGVANTVAGTAVASQTAGDCHKSQCDGSGNIVATVDDTDLPDDSKPCTADICTSGVAGHTNVAARTACGTALMCDGLGACLACISPADCSGTDTECQSRTCTAGVCGVANTAVGVAVTTQTPGDCHKNQCDGAGNVANSVDDTDVPNDSKQCTSDTCSSGTPANANLAADTDCTESGGKVCDGHGTCGPYNLAGNGSLEYGTLDGWSTFGGTNALSDTSATGFAHAGQYSVVNSGRTEGYHGPSYKIPTGPGSYIITGWGMQNELATFNASLSVALTCGADTGNNFYPPAAYNVAMAQGTWVKFSGTVNTSASDPKCALATPGDIRAATLYLNQNTSTPFPNLFLDDVVVQVTDGHNLIGVPTFEVPAVTSGWSNNGGGTLAISTTNFHGGAAGLGVTGRTGTYNGPAYTLPLGKAVYNLSIWAMHTGTVAHDLVITVAYRCLGEADTRYVAAATASGVAASTWTQLSAANWAMPPAGATAGCRLSQASFYIQQERTANSGEFPDLFVDDASLTVAP